MTTISWDRSALAQLELDVSRQVLVERGNRVRNAALRLAPVDTGRLRASITVSIQNEGTGLVARIGSNANYAIFVHEGTGIYAGRGMIRPRTKSVLAWQGPGGRMVFARAVRGQRGKPYLRDALPAAG